MNYPRVRTGLLGIMIVMTLGVVGCGASKEFTPDEFATITKDMTEAKVIEVLGKPKEDVEAMGSRRLFWVVKDKYYSISFTDGKVIAPLAHADKADYDMMIGLMKTMKNLPK